MFFRESNVVSAFEPIDELGQSFHSIDIKSYVSIIWKKVFFQ